MRNSRNQFELRNVNDTHMRFVGFRELDEIVGSGDAVRIYERQHGHSKKLIGAKLTARASQAVDTAKTVISKGEMELNAAAKIFPGNQSRTAGLPEYRRQQHVNPRTNRVEEEDFTEHTEAKVGLWPMVGDEKAVRVGPSVDAEAIYLALYLMEQHRRDLGYSVTTYQTSFGDTYQVIKRVQA